MSASILKSSIFITSGRSLLPFELIPETSRHLNLREFIYAEHWERVRQATFEAAGGVCQGCGVAKEKVGLQCHEVWEFDRTTTTQRLVKLEALCSWCHEFKHFDLTILRENGDRILRHAMRTTKLGAEAIIRVFKEQLKERKRLDKIYWHLDLSLVRPLGVRVKRSILVHGFVPPMGHYVNRHEEEVKVMMFCERFGEEICQRLVNEKI